MKFLPVLFLAGALAGAAGTAAAQAPDSAAKPRYTLFQPTPRAQLRKLHPDRPGITESAFTIDPGHFQVEANLFRVRNGREQGVRRRELLFNQAVLKLGISEQTDLQLVVESYTIEKEWPQENAAPERNRGFGDLTLRAKRNIFGDDGESRGALAVATFVRVPTGGNVGNGGWEAGVSVPFTYKLAETSELSVQMRGNWEHDRDAGQHFISFMPAATVNHDLNKVLGVYAELMSNWDTRQALWRTTLNVGPEFTLSENCQLDLGAGLPLTRETYWEFFLGLTLRR
ncbi:transporter [Hymenobacter sublimis]|uniref:Transporter n=1 Tax=Hymenobacter sublimis TaxID=2933777 RepID=A0ABY4J6Z5_9BACT|nr:transporter [Hymenobacter sublimis]UPL48590.1 transporter [Hymenobacter sublimis]